MRYVNLGLAYFFLMLAGLGVLLPLVPTVPFLLLAAWFAARGSVRLHRWLYAQPYFGQVLTDWEAHGAVSRKSKVLAISMMLLSWAFSLWYGNGWVISILSAVFVCVIVFLLTRPEPR